MLAKRRARRQLPLVRVRAGVQGVAEGPAQGRGPTAHPGGVGRGPAGAGGAGEVGAGGGALVQWLAAAGLPLDPGVAVGAAGSGQLELVKWLFAAPRSALVKYAAEGGRLVK